MTIDEYRIQFGWSRQRLAKEAGIDVTTLRHAMHGQPIYRAKAGQITEAINRELVRRGQPRITYTDFDGVTFTD
jgi:hypothetical protein